MTPVNEMLLAVSSSLAASLVAKVTVIMALALFAVWLARGRRAAVRHAFLAAAFGVTLLLPFASVLVPPVRLAVPMAVENRVSAAPLLVKAAEIIPPVLAMDVPDVHAIPVPKISPASLLLTVWIAGVAIFLLPLVIGLWQIRLLRRSGLPWLHGRSLAETIARDAGIHRRVEVLLHEEVPGPMTCGTVHPTIMLPHDAESWSGEDLSRAFVHELEHVRRGDSVSSFLARGACAVYWFHPLVWIAWRRLALEAERSCDDAVLRHSDATAYAEQLVGLAKRLYAAQRSPLVAMANRADLTTRVRAVLDVRQRRGRAGASFLALACCAAAVLITVTSPLRLVAEPQAGPAATLRFEVASVKPNKSTDFRLQMESLPGGTLRVINFPLKLIILKAFGLPLQSSQRLSGGPDWINTEKYDIEAKAEASAVPAGLSGKSRSDRLMLMLQTLLADRFKLTMHRETKQMTIYALIGSKNGPKVQRAKIEEKDCPELSSLVGPAPGTGYCHAFFGGQGRGIHGKTVTMSDLATWLENWTDHPVIDKTGFNALFDIDTEGWASMNAVPSPALSEPAGDSPQSLVSVLDKVGLKLEPTKGAVEVIVIDHVERPGEN